MGDVRDFRNGGGLMVAKVVKRWRDEERKGFRE